MRIVLAAASLALLAASAPAAEPELVAMRAMGIAGCSAEVTPRAQAGTDVAGLCGCAVDRLMAGKTAAQLRETGRADEQEALNACAGARGVALAPRSDAPAPANAAEPAEEGNSVE